MRCRIDKPILPGALLGTLLLFVCWSSVSGQFTLPISNGPPPMMPPMNVTRPMGGPMQGPPMMSSRQQPNQQQGPPPQPQQQQGGPQPNPQQGPPMQNGPANQMLPPIQINPVQIDPVTGRSLFSDFGVSSLFGGGGSKKFETKLEDEYEGDYKEEKGGKKLPEHGGIDKFKGDIKNKFDGALKKFDKEFKEPVGKQFKPKQKEEYGEGYEEGYDEQGYKSKGGAGKGKGKESGYGKEEYEEEGYEQGPSKGKGFKGLGGKGGKDKGGYDEGYEEKGGYEEGYKAGGGKGGKGHKDKGGYEDEGSYGKEGGYEKESYGKESNKDKGSAYENGDSYGDEKNAGYGGSQKGGAPKKSGGHKTSGGGYKEEGGDYFGQNYPGHYQVDPQPKGKYIPNYRSAVPQNGTQTRGSYINQGGQPAQSYGGAPQGQQQAPVQYAPAPAGQQPYGNSVQQSYQPGPNVAPYQGATNGGAQYGNNGNRNGQQQSYGAGTGPSYQSQPAPQAVTYAPSNQGAPQGYSGGQANGGNYGNAGQGGYSAGPAVGNYAAPQQPQGYNSQDQYGQSQQGPNGYAGGAGPSYGAQQGAQVNYGPVGQKQQSYSAAPAQAAPAASYDDQYTMSSDEYDRSRMKIYPVKIVQTAPELVINDNPYAVGGGSGGAYGGGPSAGGYREDSIPKFNIVPYGGGASSGGYGGGPSNGYGGASGGSGYGGGSNGPYGGSNGGAYGGSNGGSGYGGSNGGAGYSGSNGGSYNGGSNGASYAGSSGSPYGGGSSGYGNSGSSGSYLGSGNGGSYGSSGGNGYGSSASSGYGGSNGYNPILAAASYDGGAYGGDTSGIGGYDDHGGSGFGGTGAGGGGYEAGNVGGYGGQGGYGAGGYVTPALSPATAYSLPGYSYARPPMPAPLYQYMAQFPQLANYTSGGAYMPVAVVNLYCPKGKKCSCTLYMTEISRVNMLVSGVCSGLDKDKTYSLHIYEYGDITSGCDSLGGHYNPKNSTHGYMNGPTSHIGDLGNIKTDANGVAFVNKLKRDSLSVMCDASGNSYSVLGRSLGLSDSKDDYGLGGTYESLAYGSSGKIIACGVIGLANKDNNYETREVREKMDAVNRAKAPQSGANGQVSPAPQGAPQQQPQGQQQENKPEDVKVQ